MGTVVLSIDAELAWGFHDQQTLPADRLRGARRGWLTILDILDAYHIPTTWAVVGHLMLDGCDGRHPEHPSPPGWFDRDRGGVPEEESLWCAPELVEAIQTAETNHELASHTFSHLPFARDDVTRDMIDAELERHQEIAEGWGIPLRSFVFPRNQVGFLDRLAAHGFACYRGTEPGSERTLRRPRKTYELLAGGGHPPVTQPNVDDHGLVNIPATLDLFGFEGVAKRVAEPFVGDPIISAAATGIEAVAERDGIFHGWLHPNNLKRQEDVKRLETICQIIHDTDVKVQTMGSIAEEYQLQANV